MNKYELIRDNIQPVILGSSAKTRKVAKELFLRYGIVSYICDEKRPSPLSSLFRISSVSLRLSSSANFDVVCDELFRLAATDTSCVWLLCATENFADLIKEKRDILESVFIISELDGIPSSHPLLAQEDKPKERKKQAIISGGKINVS